MKFNILKKVNGSGSTAPKNKFAYLAHINDIQSFPKADYKGVSLTDDIVMKEKTGMAQIYMTPAAQEYTYETVGDSDSKSFKIKFVGTHPGTELEALEFARNYLEEGFVILIPSCEVGLKVLGTLDAPLVFTSSHKSDKDSQKFIFTFEQEIGTEYVYQLYTGLVTLNENIDVDMGDFLEHLKDYIKLDGSNLSETQKQNLRTILGSEGKNLGNNDLSLNENRSLNLGSYFLNFFSNIGAKIGINKNNPTQALEVVGNVKSDGLIISGHGNPDEEGSLKREGNEIKFKTSEGWETLMFKRDYVSDSYGLISPTTPIPVGGWKTGWYTPKISSATPGTNYPNQDNLKSKAGFFTEFYYNGSVWEEISIEIVRGKSAYQTWIDLGNVGTEKDFIDSLNAVSVPTLSIINYPTSSQIPSGFFKTGNVNSELITIQRKEEAFIIKIKTDNPGTSSGTQFTFVGIGTYKIDWGDGTIETRTGTATHTYAVPGIYITKVYPGLNYIRYANGSDRLKLLAIINWGTIKWTSFQDAFWGCENLELQATDYPDLSTVAVFQRAFMGCTNFKGHESMKSWNMTNATNTQNMFSTSGFNTDVSNWRFSRNLTLINGMWFKTKIGLGGVPDSDIMNKFIINLANWAFETGTPLNVNAGGHGNYYTSKKYSITGQFNNAIDAMAYLTGTLNWTWAESSLAKTVLQDGQFDKGYMVLGVDDGYISWNNLFLPLLTEKNIKATFFVSQAYIDHPTSTTYTTWAKIKELYNAGHDIENHTWEHVNLAGAAFNERRTRDNVDKVDDKLAANGMPRSLHISYPFGGHTDNTKKWLRRDTFLKTGRKTRINPTGGPLPEFDGLITTKVDKFAIPAEPFTGTMSSGHLERFKMLLDQAKAEKKALVVYAHEFTTEDSKVDNSGNWITMDLAEAIIDYCISIGVEIITHDKLYTLLDPNTP
jgi:peptidoglycan/xylan/chitin deacetylase (PgdA/CDA1 family)